MKFNEAHFWKFCAQLKIPTKEFGEATFSNPLGTQRYFIRKIAEGLNEDAHTFVTLKGRQQGISTVMLALDLYWAFKYRGIMATLIAQDELTRDDFRAKIAMYYKSLPREWRQGTTSHNRNQFLFANKSGIVYQIAGNRAGNKLGRGKAITFMHATELGSWSNNKDGLSSLQASLAEMNPARLFVYESTANGYDMFHDLYATAESSVTQRAVFVPWWMNEFYAVDESVDNPVFRTYFGKPCARENVVKQLEQSEVGWYRAVQRQFDYSLSAGQIAWWRWKLNEQFNDLDMMLQEFPPLADYAFRLTGSQFFPSAPLNDALEEAKTAEFIPYNIRFGLRFQDMAIDECAPAYADLKIWQPAVEDAKAKGHYYVLGADVAYGSSEWKDASVAHLYRCYGDRIELACEYHSTNCNPTQFAWVIAFLAGLYGNTLVNLEVNGPGQVTYQELDQLARIAMSVKTTENREIGNVMRHIRHYLYNKYNGGSRQGNVRHWVTTASNKDRMLSAFRDSFTRELVYMPSVETIEEMKQCVRDGSYIGGGARDDKDDRVMASSLAHVAWMDNLRVQLMGQGVTKKRAVEAERQMNANGKPSVIGHMLQDFNKQRGLRH
jgi:hypothetical protein